MNTRSRIIQLEKSAASLPPNGHALLRKLERLPEHERAGLWAQMTDAELEAVANTDPHCDGLDWSKLADSELQYIAEETNPAALDAWFAQLRTLKPDYFTKGD